VRAPGADLSGKDPEACRSLDREPHEKGGVEMRNLMIRFSGLAMTAAFLVAVCAPRIRI
jgi:hypothetical protein